jgi:addiction module RelE/StbE family toxin
MEEIRSIVFSELFERQFRKIKDRSTQDKVEKQIRKITSNPYFGKPLRHDLKGERTTYVKPYRLIYKVEGSVITILRFDHRDQVYGH